MRIRVRIMLHNALVPIHSVDQNWHGTHTSLQLIQDALWKKLGYLVGSLKSIKRRDECRDWEGRGDERTFIGGAVVTSNSISEGWEAAPAVKLWLGIVSRKAEEQHPQHASHKSGDRYIHDGVATLLKSPQVAYTHSHALHSFFFFFLLLLLVAFVSVSIIKTSQSSSTFKFLQVWEWSIRICARTHNRSGNCLARIINTGSMRAVGMQHVSIWDWGMASLRLPDVTSWLAWTGQFGHGSYSAL